MKILLQVLFVILMLIYSVNSVAAYRAGINRIAQNCLFKTEFNKAQVEQDKGWNEF